MTDDDLVSRLRRGVTWSTGEQIGAVVGAVNDPIMAAAADRIETLQARNAELEGALTIIADDNSWRGFSPLPIVERMREIARTALSTETRNG